VPNFLKGKEFEKRIKTYANGYQDLEKKLLPFMKTEKGFKVSCSLDSENLVVNIISIVCVFIYLIRQISNDFKTRISDNFPWLEDELRGLSDGSGIPLETVYINQNQTNN
jgi:hypothetical protein